MIETKAFGMDLLVDRCDRISEPAIYKTIAAIALILAIASCGNIDIRRERISTGGLTETPLDKATDSREAGGIVSSSRNRFTLAEAGDSVTSIARRFGIDAGELSRMNGKHPFEPLRAGEVIVLPDSSATASVSNAEDAASSSPVPIEQIRYRVQRGDTAFSIARSFGVSARIVAEWNNLGPGFEVREDQILLIPLPRNSTAQVAALSDDSVDTPIPSIATDPLPDYSLDAALPPSPQLDQYRTEAGNEPKLLIPVNGEILNSYTGAGGNEGIDIAALPGTSVRAADNGTVALVTRATDNTIILLLRHENDLYTVYSNLEQTDMNQNDSVLRGQSIGKSAGGEPPYVHFEVRIGANSVDPESYI
ncbi:MAG: peptidoglycan DD-metalloendopeptidase family protein [Albidovulum sp.]|nr:peptidoglycan DD-metalloendopeptidase family protein [Albidovulum sp.]